MSPHILGVGLRPDRGACAASRVRFGKINSPARCYSRKGPFPHCFFGPSKLNNVIICLQTLTEQLTNCQLSLNPDRHCNFLLRKEVIQPHLPIRLPCYDLAPIIDPTLGGALLAVRLPMSGVTDFHGLTGGVYKTRERIHRGMLIRDY